jgi:hypothetical protein
LGQIVKNSAKSGLTLTINPASPLDVETILEALRPAIMAAKFAKNCEFFNIFNNLNTFYQPW